MHRPGPAGEIFSIQGIEGSRSRQDGPCLSVTGTGPVSEAAGLEPDGAVIHPPEEVERSPHFIGDALHDLSLHVGCLY